MSVGAHSYASLLGINLDVESLGEYGYKHVELSYLMPIIFQSDCTKFTYPPAMCDGSDCFTSSPTLAVFCLFHVSYSGGYVMVSQCGFHLHVPDD